MNKTNQQREEGTNISNQLSKPRFLKRNILRLAWILTLCMCIADWLIIALCWDESSSIDVNGFLLEPLFGLIPLGYFFLFVVILLALLDIILTFKNRC